MLLMNYITGLNKINHRHLTNSIIFNIDNHRERI